MEKENRVKIEDMAQFEYLKTMITTRLFGNINTLDVDHVIPADVKHDHNTSKFENWKKVKWVIMDEVENSPFYESINPIILHKLLDYYFGDRLAPSTRIKFLNGGGALEELGWDII